MWFLITLWILILAFNAAYSFLPNKLQGRKWIRLMAMGIATLILLRGIYQEIDIFRTRSFAYVTPNGQITKSNNFPWKITHVEPSEDSIYYMLNKRSDGSEVTVIPDNSACEPNVYGATSGLCIQFDCPPSRVSGFKIVVKQ